MKARPIGFAVVAMAALIACACLSVPAARGAWLPAIAATPTGTETSVIGAQVATDAAGNVTAVWSVGAVGSRGIRSAYRPAGGDWQPPVNRIGLTSTFDCHDPRLAVDASGDAAVVAECEKPSASIRAAYRPGASWSGGAEIPGSGSGEKPRVGIAGTGNAVAVWAAPGSTVKSSAHTLAGGAWTAAVQISAGGELAEAPNIGVNTGTGYAHAAWLKPREEPPGSDPVVEVRGARRTPGGSWESPFTITQPAFPTTPVVTEEPQIYVSTSGERLYGYAWQAATGILSSRISSSDFAGYSTPGFVTDPLGPVEEPRFAIGGAGRATTAWRVITSGGLVLARAAVITLPGGTWSAATTVGETSVGTEPVLAADAAGDATIAWYTAGTIQSGRRLAAGGFEPTQTISNPANNGFGSPAVAMTAAGDGLAVWSSEADHLAFAVDDRTAPILTPSVPASAEAGASVAMSATATDLWSDVSLSWDFGDGATATGSPVSHVYATAGAKTATVTATDAAGNSSSAAIPVTVTAESDSTPPPPPPPHKVVLTANAVPQPWKQIAKARALKLRCKLDVSGSCAAKASIAAGVAKRIGLKVGKGKKEVPVGKGFATARAGQFVVVKVKLTGKALADIAAATKPVPVAFAVTGSAGGSDPTTLLRRLKISRP